MDAVRQKTVDALHGREYKIKCPHCQTVVRVAPGLEFQRQGKRRFAVGERRHLRAAQPVRGRADVPDGGLAVARQRQVRRFRQNARRPHQERHANKAVSDSHVLDSHMEISLFKFRRALYHIAALSCVHAETLRFREHPQGIQPRMIHALLADEKAV